MSATDPLDIERTFVSRWTCPTQAQLDTLHKRLGIPVEALIRDGDGGGMPMGTLRVERTGRTFDFSDDPAVKPVCGFMARDRWGEPLDLVVWSPRDDWTGTWLGRAVLLGEHELPHPRMRDPLPVYLGVLSWLLACRTGCVILNPKHAWRQLEGVTIKAETVETGLRLRKVLSPPDPKIVVPAAITMRAAA